jgi:hypothetical protein
MILVHTLALRFPDPHPFSINWRTIRPSTPSACSFPWTPVGWYLDPLRTPDPPAPFAECPTGGTAVLDPSPRPKLRTSE